MPDVHRLPAYYLLVLHGRIRWVNVICSESGPNLIGHEIGRGILAFIFHLVTRHHSNLRSFALLELVAPIERVRASDALIACFIFINQNKLIFSLAIR